jgi:hypothetical protein
MKNKVEKLLAEKDISPVKARTCIFCGGEIYSKRAKNTNHTPYVRCLHCLSLMYLNTDIAVSGYEIISKMVAKNPQYFQAVRNRANQKIKAMKEREENKLLGIED